ncbi:MAG: patatin-like phospholipase family protein [Chloroflexota bacterium]|nr:patatin-like phospholipase family protein [Chloroflexota bacterium]
MRPFREHVAVAIDGGGIRGVIPARALAILEDHLGRPSREIFHMAAGTSTGSIIAAGIGMGLTGAAMHRLYTMFGPLVFHRSWRAWLWPLVRYRYPLEPLRAALRRYIGDRTMGDFWTADSPIDVVITTFDVVENRTRFVKPWKEEYADWPVVKAVLASSSVPTYFPPVEARFVDGGVGAYSNPCYLAAYEGQFVLDWDPARTTLISLGTGRDPHSLRPKDVMRFWPWQWIGPVLGAFLRSADDQQVHLVDTFFEALDFRRFQVDLPENVAMDDFTRMAELTVYGTELGQKILNDQTDRALEIKARKPEPRCK